MNKFIVLIVGIVWASLLLISWGGAEDIASAPVSAPVQQGDL